MSEPSKEAMEVAEELCPLGSMRAISGQWKREAAGRIDRAIEARMAPLVEALEMISGLEGMTLLGQDPQHEFIPHAFPEEDRAHESGANKAFGQCAAIAKEALAKAKDPPAVSASVAALRDLADMPGRNPVTGEHGLHSVSDGRVVAHPTWHVACVEHGAMNCVNPERTIWRCLQMGCREGAYREPTP